jgi:hypothetical protein
MRLISWNMAHTEVRWREVVRNDQIDVALLQEAVLPPAGLVVQTIPSPDQPWVTAGANRRFCAAIARLSDRVGLQPIVTKPLAEAGRGELGVSLPGTLTACVVTDESGEEFTVASVYGAWATPMQGKEGGWIYAGASVHRLISDLSALVGSQRGHKIIVAGDLNILYGHGEHGSDYWKARYETVFTRMAAIGLPFAGPQHPHGEQCAPWPAELPRHSKNVPTFRTRRSDPASATRQLDFVFASIDLSDRLRVRACNTAAAWGRATTVKLKSNYPQSSEGEAWPMNGRAARSGHSVPRRDCTF